VAASRKSHTAKKSEEYGDHDMINMCEAIPGKNKDQIKVVEGSIYCNAVFSW
jgi:hypothetical protein